MRLKNELDPNAKTLSSIAKSLKKFPQGIQKRFDELGIKGTEYKGRVWYSEKEINQLKEYLDKSEIPTEYKYSIYDFKKDLNKDYGTIKRCVDCLGIKGFTDLHNKTFYNEQEKNKLYNFINIASPYELQQLLAKNTFMKKYGVDNPMKLKSIQKKNKSEFDDNLKLKVQEYEQTHNIKLLSTKELCERFDRDKTTLPLVYNSLNIPIINIDGYYFIDEKYLADLEKYFSFTENHTVSYSEKELSDFVKSLGVEIIENDRTIISPKELDIYIPSKKLAIEFDGLYYHSELFVNKNYHLDKTNECNEKGIDLIHVFEDDWVEHKEIVKSMIKSRLGIYDRKIFARKCQIKEISKHYAFEFFETNHLQGYAKNCDLNLGLFYEDELMQAISITFKGWHDGNTELTRMTTKLNVQVIGGFSKLVSYFCKNYNCDLLVSYVYKAWFNGKGYLASGFKAIKENNPSYSYILNKKRFHKSGFRKDKLKRMLEKGKIKIYSDNMTESEICRQNGIYRIYDCGTVKMEYKYE